MAEGIGRRAALLGAGGALGAAVSPGTGRAQDAARAPEAPRAGEHPGAPRAGEYPGAQPVTVVLPYTAGGSQTAMGTVLTQGLTQRLGGSFVMDYKPGASTALAARHVARSRPDGRTLLIGTVTTFTLLPNAMRDPGFDPVADFAHLTMIGATLYVLVVNPRWRSLEQLVAEAKRRPNGVSFASWGVGSTGHLLILDFARRAGVEVLHVPYNGSAPALTDLMAGRVDAMFSTYAPALPLVEGGRLRPLGVPLAARRPDLPEVPTMIELGYPDFVAQGWFSLAAPARTPAPVLEMLERAAVDSFRDPAAWPALERVGVAETPLGSAVLNERLRRELVSNRELMRSAGLQPE